MLITNKRIAIVGGGPGGLTLARLLQLKGANVMVYERDLNEHARVQGTTLDLHEESGLAALQKAGLIHAFYANYRPEAGKLRILDKHANVHMDEHAVLDFSEDRPEIDRGPLRRILLDSLLPDTVVWDSRFTSMAKEGGVWKLSFANGTTADADLVIGADGANSRVRPYITDIRPIYSGVTAVEGYLHDAERDAPTLHKLTDGGKVFILGDERSLALGAKGDGSLGFYIGIKVEETWVRDSGIDFREKAQVLGWFNEAFGSWNPVYQELFASEDVGFLPRPQYHYPLDQIWETLPDLTMIGDAAHVMPPYAGEGVNMAMQDALELSECLARTDLPDLQAALMAFEEKMLTRTSACTQETLESTEMLHSEDSLGKLLHMFSGMGPVAG